MTILGVLISIFATLGVFLQVVGASYVRAGNLPESYTISTVVKDSTGTGYFEVVVAFERELVVDAGNAMLSVASLLLYCAVIASLAISFPKWSGITAVGLGLALLATLHAIIASADDLLRKRTRQQNMFDLVKETYDPSVVEYLIGRHRSLDRWRDLVT